MSQEESEDFSCRRSTSAMNLVEQRGAALELRHGACWPRYCPSLFATVSAQLFGCSFLFLFEFDFKRRMNANSDFAPTPKLDVIVIFIPIVLLAWALLRRLAMPKASGKVL